MELVVTIASRDRTGHRAEICATASTMAPSSSTGAIRRIVLFQSPRNAGVASHQRSVVFSSCSPIIVIVTSDAPNNPHYRIRLRIVDIESFQEPVRKTKAILHPRFL